VIPCAAASVLFLIQFWITDPIGNFRSQSGANPYETRWGAALLQSWATYFSWAFRFVHLVESDLHDRVTAHPEGWWLTAAWLLGCASVLYKGRRLGGGDPRWRIMALGVLMYAAFIAPVLPLATHAFHLYLYLPLVGLGWSLGAIWDAWVPRPANRLAFLVAVLLVVQGMITVRSIEALPLRDTQLPFMGSVRRALVADRLLQALSSANTPLPDSLALIGPDGLSPPTRPDTTALGAFLFNDVAGAIDQGSAIRLRFPQVRHVEFYGDLGPWLRTPDVAVFDYAGNVLRGPTAWLYLRRAQVEWQAGRIPTSSDAVRRAFEMTRLWKTSVRPPWREEGLGAIRALAEAMIAEETPLERAADDPRRAMSSGYLHAVAQVAEIAR